MFFIGLVKDVVQQNDILLWGEFCSLRNMLHSLAPHIGDSHLIVIEQLRKSGDSPAQSIIRE